jgi:hypothetical protein
MSSVYVLFRWNGTWPSVEHICAVSGLSKAKAAATKIEGPLHWMTDRAGDGLIYAKAGIDSQWEGYGIVYLVIDQSTMRSNPTSRTSLKSQ